MPGHAILSHGLNSSPAATKVSAMAEVAESMGWTTERPDYQDLDATQDIRRIDDRIERLLVQARACGQRPLVLAGSSMGAFISALASREVRIDGLFLMVPPVVKDGYPRQLAAASVPTTVIHAWGDELIPSGDVIRWASQRRDKLILVDDEHRLTNHVQFCADTFGRFLKTIG